MFAAGKVVGSYAMMHHSRAAKHRHAIHFQEFKPLGKQTVKQAGAS